MSEKIIDKLAKLIKHEQSARSIGNMHEAEAFAGRIQILLTQHQLSMSDIDIEAETQDVEQVGKQGINPRDIGQKFTGKRIQWQITLLKWIAKTNNCSTLITQGSNFQTVVGFNADRQNVVAVYSYFVKLAQELCETHFTVHKMSPEYQAYMADDFNWVGEKRAYSRTWKRSWLEGFVAAVTNRMWVTYSDTLKVAEDQNQCQGLVHLRNKQALVKDFMNNGNYKNISQSKAGVNSSAYGQGKAVGNGVALSGKAIAA